MEKSTLSSAANFFVRFRRDRVLGRKCMKSDSDLLQEFVQRRSQPAFAELVGRYVDLVYSAAVRQVNGDTHLARDVAQSVFIGLSRQAGDLRSRDSLVGWLYTSVHHAAANAVRTERRRQLREQKAFAMQQIEQEENHRPDWERLRPVLDAAMLELDEADREAVLRRFFSGESFVTIGAALELSHEAARKRVDRALDRLHGLLARRGVRSSASALGLTIAQHAVSAAPVGFGGAVTHAAFSGAGGLLTAGGVFLMNKLTIGVTAAVIAALVALVVVERNSLARSETELALKRQDLASLTASLYREEQGLAAREAKLRELTAARAAAAGSLVEQVPPITSTERLQLDSTYAAMFRRLRLEGEKLAAFKELLALRIRADREARAVLRSRGMDFETLPESDANTLRLIAARDVDVKIEALLGKEGLEYVQTYERTLARRAPFRDLEVMLAATGESLSPETVDQLVAWSATDGDVRSAVLPENVVARAGSLLTPFQLEKLKVVQASRNALPELLSANLAGAKSGKLTNLVPQSQREIAEWMARTEKTAGPGSR
jgi:RNA polymerase sigma factor (sigma-70 family)